MGQVCNWTVGRAVRQRSRHGVEPSQVLCGMLQFGFPENRHLISRLEVPLTPPRSFTASAAFPIRQRTAGMDVFPHFLPIRFKMDVWAIHFWIFAQKKKKSCLQWNVSQLWLLQHLLELLFSSHSLIGGQISVLRLVVQISQKVACLAVLPFIKSLIFTESRCSVIGGGGIVTFMCTSSNQRTPCIQWKEWTWEEGRLWSLSAPLIFREWHEFSEN